MPSPALNVTLVPSGDTLGALALVDEPRGMRPVPSAFITQSLWLLRKTIRWPSGVHAGASPVPRCLSSVPSMFTVAISTVLGAVPGRM
jgi:hypothetical protein